MSKPMNWFFWYSCAIAASGLSNLSYDAKVDRLVDGQIDQFGSLMKQEQIVKLQQEKRDGFGRMASTGIVVLGVGGMLFSVLGKKNENQNNVLKKKIMIIKKPLLIFRRGFFIGFVRLFWCFAL